MCRPGGRVIARPVPPPVVVTQPTSVVYTPPKPLQPQGPVPLQSVNVNVTILDFTAKVELKQKFKNIESNPIEAVYQFPMDEKNTICDFVALIDGKKIKGECQEKQTAKDTYDDSIASGSGAYLLEQSEEAPNIFTVNVGNLPPQKEAEIQITYVQELEFTPEGELKFILASTKAGEAISSGYTPGKSIPLGLSVNLSMTSNIRSLSSPSHPISFEFGEEPNKATVSLAADGKDQGEKDFVLHCKLAKPHQPCGRLGKDASGNFAAMVSFYPQITLAEDEDIYTEMIFLVDRSGSMAGSRINQVKDTLAIFLRSLGEGTMFNIVGFGSRTEFLFKSGSVEYNDKNLETATKHVSSMSANLGGTNILKPLQEILKAKAIEGYPRQLFILTDGEVSNTKECIDFVRQHADTTRVFTFGVGSDASQDLVKGMAKAGEGFYEFVVSGESMESKVMKQLNRAMQPAFTDLKVEWGNLNAQQSPFRLPPLFVGGRMVVYGFLPSGTTGEAEVKMTAKTAAKPFETTIKLNFDSPEAGDMVHKLASRAMIRDLEEKRSYLHNESGALISGKTENDVKNEEIRLSSSYGVLCKFTAFVAVEERREATEGTMQSRKFGISIEKAQAPPQIQPSITPYTPYPLQQSPSPYSPYAPYSQQQAQPSINYSLPGSGYLPTGGAYARSSSASYGAPPARPAMAPAYPTSAASYQSADLLMAAPESKNKSLGGGGGFLSGLLKKKESAAPPPARSGARLMEEESSRKRSQSPEKRKRKKEVSHKDTRERQEAKSSISYDSFAECEDEAGGAPVYDLAAAPSSYAAELSMPPAAYPAPSSTPVSAPKPAPAAKPVEKAPSAEMKAILLKQKASGAWALGDVSGLLGKLTADKIRAGMPKDGASEAESWWVTAVVAAYLQKVFPDDQTNWQQVVNKAKRFLAKAKKSEWVQLAEDFVKNNS